MTDDSSSSSMDVPTKPGGRSRPPKRQAPAARLVVLRGSQAGQEIQLEPGVILFGREEGIPLHDQRISRRHAQIQDIGGEYMLTDLNSTNGTYVNGQRIIQPKLLQHGDTIRFGDTILVLKYEVEGYEAPPALGARTPDLGPDQLSEPTLLVSRMMPIIPPKNQSVFPEPSEETPQDSPPAGKDDPSPKK